MNRLNAFQNFQLKPAPEISPHCRVKLISHTRERKQILALVGILQRRQDLLQPQQSAWLSLLQEDCGSFIRSAAADSGFMLCDRPDVADIPVINGNEPRNSQLRQINERYCVEVLLIWFQCLFKQSDTNSMQLCNNFLSFVENIQPRVVQYLQPNDVSLLLKRQTESMVRSTTFMYEALCLDDKDFDDY